MSKVSVCAAVLALLVQAVGSAATPDFTACLSQIQNFTSTAWQDGMLRYNNGSSVSYSDRLNAMAIDYRTCERVCGSGNESFQWANFSQQFSAWLLPYLALLSQLPFGARYRLDNLMSAILTAGSPTLAGYALFCTLLNTRWISRSFESVKTFPNTAKAARILSNLQQLPIRVDSRDAMLASLVVLPENDDWWSEFSDALNYKTTWSISAAVSIAWVVIAYALTVSQSLAAISDSFETVGRESIGQSIGTAFIWVIPIIIGWQQLSPKSDYDRLVRAFRHSDPKAFVATEYGSQPLRELTEERAISIGPGMSMKDDLVSPDECATPPIFNYARIFGWSRGAEEVFLAFERASRHVRAHVAVNPEVGWKNLDEPKRGIHSNNRRGSPVQVERYCRRPGNSHQSPWASGIFGRVALASIAALMLQWGTTGSAVLMAWFTPTTKLGCRSIGYLTYGALSTVIWMLMLVSSVITHYAASYYPKATSRSINYYFWSTVANVLRRAGKVLAVLNSIILVGVPILQFSDMFNNCYCNSSVPGRGIVEAYSIIIINPGDVDGLRSLWILSVVIAAGCCAVYVGTLNLLTDTLAFRRA